MKTAAIQVTLIDSMGSDLSVCNAARVSFEKLSHWDEKTTPNCWRCDGHGYWKDDNKDFHDCFCVERTLAVPDAKLISYLAKHKHTSPFNHCFASFRVKAPIFVARQLVKHKFLPWNEVSRRYVDSEPEFYFPEFFRGKAENVKQGSSDAAVLGNGNLMAWTKTDVGALLESYLTLIDNGVCPEQARMVLPLNTMTEWIWSGSLGAFADMCRLRLDPHAQKESRDVAELISAEMSRLYPVSWEALLKNN